MKPSNPGDHTIRVDIPSSLASSLSSSVTQFACKMSSYGLGPPRRFRGSDSWRPEDDRSSNDFSFRNSSAAPQYPREHDHYEPSPKRPRSRQNDDRVRNSRGSGSNRRNENGSNFHARPSQRSYPGFQRGRGNRHVATATRPLLSLRQADTVEQTLGAASDPNVVKRFLHVDDMTDSEEEQMEESDSDQDTSNEPVPHSTEADPVEPPVKRRPLEIAINEINAGSQAPKWSNPDPYTSLPPLDELRKRKDVVKIIRKARITIERGVSGVNESGIDEDFISFGFEEAAAPKRRPIRSSSLTDEVDDEAKLTVASSEPKRFSHRQNLYGEYFTKAPGTVDMALSTDIKGPPPGLIPKLPPDADIATYEISHMDQNDPLGSRKRTYDDVIKNPPEKPFSELSDNFLLGAWLPSNDTYPTPWLDNSAGRCENIGFRYYSPTRL